MHLCMGNINLATSKYDRHHSSSLPIEFTADHPFIYQIVDAEKNIILFTGRCLDPTNTSPFYISTNSETDITSESIEKLTI